MNLNCGARNGINHVILFHLTLIPHPPVHAVNKITHCCRPSNQILHMQKIRKTEDSLNNEEVIPIKMPCLQMRKGVQ